MQRRLTAILSADVAGYSGLMEIDEAGTLERLKDNRSRIFDPIVASQGGRVVKLMGDGALVEFGSVVAAVNCALAVQEATGSQDCRPRAHRGHPAAVPGQAADMADDLLVVRRGQMAEPSRDDQRIHRSPESFQGSLALQRQTRVTADRTSSRGSHADGVGRAGAEPVSGDQACCHARDIQQLRTVVSDDNRRVGMASLTQTPRGSKLSSCMLCPAP